MKKSVDELKETMKSDKKELKDKVFMACSKLEHGIEGTFMFLYKLKPMLVLSMTANCVSSD